MMIKAFGMEEYLKEVTKKENEYLEQFGFIPLCGEDYEELRELFNDYDLGLDKFNEECHSSSFIDFGYIPF